MAAVARFIIDTSAAARSGQAAVLDRISSLISAGVVATCAPLEAEALYSARNAGEYEALRHDRRDAYEYLPTEERHWQAVLDARRGLARTGRHPAVGTTDLLTAVLAAEHGLTLLHYDADFEIAAEVIEVDQRWVVERGSIP